MREGAASVRTGRAAPSVRLAQLTVTTHAFNTADNAGQSYRAGWLTRVHYGSATSDSYNERDYRCSVLRLTRLSGIDIRTVVDSGQESQPSQSASTYLVEVLVRRQSGDESGE